MTTTEDGAAGQGNDRGRGFRATRFHAVTRGALLALVAAGCGCPTFEGARGRVVDQNGKPIAGAVVKAVTFLGTDDVGSTTTSDETGAFRLPPSDFRPHGSEACERLSISISKSGCDSHANSPTVGEDFVFQCTGQ